MTKSTYTLFEATTTLVLSQLDFLTQKHIFPKTIQVINFLLHGKNTKTKPKKLLCAKQQGKSQIEGILARDTFGRNCFVFANSNQIFRLFCTELKSDLHKNNEDFAVLSTQKTYLELAKQFFKLSFQVEYELFILPSDQYQKILNTKISGLPPNSVLEPLNEQDVELVTQFWEWGQGQEYTKNWVRHLIRDCDTSCLRLNGKLVCWSLLQDDGSISYCYTLPEYRKRV